MTTPTRDRAAGQDMTPQELDAAWARRRRQDKWLWVATAIISIVGLVFAGLIWQSTRPGPPPQPVRNLDAEKAADDTAARAAITAYDTAISKSSTTGTLDDSGMKEITTPLQYIDEQHRRQMSNDAGVTLTGTRQFDNVQLVKWEPTPDKTTISYSVCNDTTGVQVHVPEDTGDYTVEARPNRRPLVIYVQGPGRDLSGQTSTDPWLIYQVDEGPSPESTC